MQSTDLTSRDILARRRARVAFGAMLFAVAPVLTTLSFSLAFIRTWSDDRFVVPALFGLWVAAFLAGLAARCWPAPGLATRLYGRRGRRVGASTPAQVTEVDVAAHEAERLKVTSLVVPAVALGLATPLTLHALLAAVAGQVAGFSDWVRASVVLVGLAHVAFACVLGQRAVRIAQRPARSQVMSGSLASVGWATLLACVPGVMAFFVPPVLTAVTGAVLAPVILAWLQRAAREEAAATRAQPSRAPPSATQPSGASSAGAVEVM